MSRTSRYAARPMIAIAAFVALTTACQAAVSASPSASPGMTVALMGHFHAVDGEASGVAELVSLPDGSYEIVLESFSIAGTEHLVVALVKENDITSGTVVEPDALLDLGALKGTSGMQVYPIPPDMSGGVTEYHTVIIWDGAMLHAIAAAPLGQP